MSEIKKRWWIKYRIVKDRYAGYEVQCWRIYWPIWCQGTTNTHATIEAAERYAEGLAKPVVKNL